MIDNIKSLYSQVDKKNKLIEKVANDLGKKPNTLKNHWFSTFFSIPDEHQPRVIEILEETINNQSKEVSHV